MTSVESLRRQRAALPALGEVLEFMRVIWEIDHTLQQASKRMEVTLGVTGPQRLVVRIVGRFPGMPAGQLARLMHVHPSTLTGVLKRLERQGLLRRRRDPQDARRWCLGLTDKGRAFDVDGEGTVEAAIRGMLAGMPAHKIEAAREVMISIAAALSGAVPSSATKVTRPTRSATSKPRRTKSTQASA